METGNLPSSFVYINHYEFFTSENLKAFESGQPFHFKYHKEVQQFYDCRQTKVFPSARTKPDQFHNFKTTTIKDCTSTTSSNSEPSTYSTKSSNQSLNSHASSVHSSQNPANKTTFVHHFNVKPKIRHTTLSSNEPTKISSRPASFISQNNNLPAKLPPPYSSLHLIPNSTKSSRKSLSNHSSQHSSHNSTKSSILPTAKKSSSSDSFSSKTSTASISLNSSFDSSQHGSVSNKAEPKVIAQSPKQIDNNPNRTEQFLEEIRNFKLRPVEKQQPPQKVPIFKLNSNPLLTSEHLHKQLDLVRQRFNESTENSDNESQGQWSVV